MMFLSDLSRQDCSTYTTTSQQEFDVPDAPTGHGEAKGLSQTTNTRWNVSDTRSHCFQYAGKINTCSHLTECADKLNTCSHLTECADTPEDTSRTSPSARRTGETKSRTSQSTRMDQTKDFVLLDVHKRHGFALLRLRGHKLVHNTSDQSSTFPAGLTKGQLFNRFCGHQCNLTTLIDLCTDDKNSTERGILQDAQKKKKQGTRFHVSEARVQHWSKHVTGHTP